MPYMQKRNFKTHEYEPYSVPADHKPCLFSEDMDLTITCACCGKPMTYGEGYTSQQIHSSMGFGYIVCESCYTEEWWQERTASRNV